MINTITMFTAIENKKAIPRPDAMQPGRTMRLPTVAATRLLYETLHRPETADRQLLADLETLNTQANIEAVLEKGSEYRRITRHLQAALAGDLP